MGNFVLGQYVPGKSYLYKLDPRTKIIALVLMMVAVFFLKDIYFMLGAFGIVVLIMITGRISFFKALHALRHLIALSIFIFAFQVLFNHTGEVLYTKEMSFSLFSVSSAVAVFILWIFTRRYMPLKIIYLFMMIAGIYCSFAYIPALPSAWGNYMFGVYSQGLNTALFVLIRLIVVVFLATILTCTTKPTDLTLAFEWMFRPLKVIKINSEEIALMITIAIRYIPTIIDEAQKIMDAQASRGADIKDSSIGKKIGQVVSLLVPMFVLSFERSEDLADAMIARNFVPGKPKTHYHILKFRLLDLFGLIFSLCFIGGAICLFIIF